MKNTFLGMHDNQSSTPMNEKHKSNSWAQEFVTPTKWKGAKINTSQEQQDSNLRKNHEQ